MFRNHKISLLGLQRFSLEDPAFPRLNMAKPVDLKQRDSSVCVIIVPVCGSVCVPDSSLHLDLPSVRHCFAV